MAVIVTRAAWGARPPGPGPGPMDPARVQGVALHWPGMDRPINADGVVGLGRVVAALRSWQNLHMDDNGWSDIAYQEAIDQAGRVYTLRGFGTKSGANGDSDVNARYGAILLVVGPGERPSRAMVRATRSRVAAFRRRYPNGRHVTTHGRIRPGGTACPGPVVSEMAAAGAFAPRVWTRGVLIDRAIRSLSGVRASGERADLVHSALSTLRRIRPWRRS